MFEMNLYIHDVLSSSSAYDYLRFDMNAEFYSRFYTRVQPYLIGIMLGFILYKTHGKEVKISWVGTLVYH